MKWDWRSTGRTLAMFGIQPDRAARSIRGLRAYRRDLRELRRQEASATTQFPLGTPWPCLEDRFADSGVAKGHYFHQDLLVARRIFLDSPSRHVDVGSSIEGFVAHVASFRQIEVLDIRPLTSSVPNVSFAQADMMAPVPDDLVDYSDSLSCLHALEHFGLGRYGDPVNYDGYLVGLDNLHRILRRGGRFYLSVPIGLQRIEFNAHRVFSVAYLLNTMAGRYRLDRFSFVDDHGDLHEDVDVTDADVAREFGCVYGCGIFELTKL
jgi:SAM-dependent methyltransferase